MRRAAALAALVSLVLPAATLGAASLPDIEDEVMCPICGTTLELSNAPQAERERILIRQLIDRGLSKEEIKDELVAEYGPDVLAAPEDSGFDLAAWVLPIAGGALAILGVGLALRRWRRDARRDPVAAEPPEGEQAERLDADLGRYDL